jgi:hypothetical protein
MASGWYGVPIQIPWHTHLGGWAGYWLQGEKGRNVLGHSLNWGVTAVCEHLAFFFLTIDIPLWRVKTFAAYQIWWGGESLQTWLDGF